MVSSSIQLEQIRVAQTKCEDHKHCENSEGSEISWVILQLLHSGSAFSPSVASSFHGHGQLLRSSEGRDEQRHQKRNQAFGLLDDIGGLEVCTSCHLRLHDLIRLIHEGRNEPKGDAHHHGQLVGRHADLLEGFQQAFNAVCELDGRCGQRQNRCTHDKEHQSEGHEQRLIDPFPVDLEDPEIQKKRILGALGHEHVQKRREDDQDEHRFYPFVQILRGELRYADHEQDEAENQKIRGEILHQKQVHDEQDGNQNLRPGVQLMDEGFSGNVLSDGDILDHNV